MVSSAFLIVGLLDFLARLSCLHLEHFIPFFAQFTIFCSHVSLCIEHFHPTLVRDPINLFSTISFVSLFFMLYSDLGSNSF